MTFADLIFTFQWWVVLFSLGMIFLPLTSLLFHSFFDHGYAFAKILGLLLTSYIIWLLSSFRILPFNAVSIYLIIGVFLVINTYLSYKKGLFINLKNNLRIFALEEAFFAFGLLFWAFVKTHEPSIHGLEKFMDFGFINSILQSTYFPPADTWLTPFSINYYYFGHLVTAVLIKISSIDPVISYNLMLASLFGLCFAGAFSISANLYHHLAHNISSKLSTRYTLLSGVLGGFLVTLGGNLHTIYIFFQSYNTENPVPFWQLPLSLNTTSYWYPNATRFIPFTIHEFPLYSFVVSDLHGHVLNIPFVLLTIALLINIFFSKLTPLRYALLSLLIATSIMTNVLDGPIYLLISFLILFFKHLQEHKFSVAFISAAKNIGIIFLGMIFFSLPFWLNFKPFASGVGVLCAPQFLVDKGHLGPLLFEADHCARSPFWMLVILWGFFYFVVTGFIIYILGGKKILNRFTSVIKKPISLSPSLSSTNLLVAALALGATILILIPEFLYVKDIYPAHYRANTVFKLGYQAFIILGLIGGYIITRLLALPKKPIFFLVPGFLLFFLVAIYPYFAVNSYYNGLKTSQSLDGLKYLSSSYPSDYQAILWMRENITGQPVVLEGQGDSYTDYARVSANTGFPTVVGWPVHEWLWRGSYDEAGKRSAEVTTLYESTDLNQTQDLIKKYQIKYIFIGPLERQKYTKLDEAKFLNLGKVIYQNGETRIYQLP